MSKSPIIFIQGPTGTGKSDCALNLASEFSAEIINCDSVQTYKHVNIGSAKPTSNDTKVCPHHLFDYIDFPEELTAGKYRRNALEVIQAEPMSEKPFFVVGGSGFYFQALEHGMSDVKSISDEVQKQVEDLKGQFSTTDLHGKLVELDPRSAEKIKPQDEYRILRALSVCLQHGKPFSEVQQEKTDPLNHPILKVGMWLERAELEPLVAQRVDKMMQLGLVAEVQSLLSKGFHDWWPMGSVGYKEVVDHLSGSYDLEECRAEIIKNTLRLAKKQRTWFKRDKEIKWFNPIAERQNDWQNVSKFISRWISGL